MTAKVFHSELWGKRENKYSRLLDSDVRDTERTALSPRSPSYLFVPRDLQLASEYETEWAVNDIFPLSSVGIVTARDRLTVHWTTEDVWNTVSDFASLEPEEARAKYNLGKDVHDWKVELAQADVRSSGPRKDKIIPILYRPFDIRITYYTRKARGFICRPREDVMCHMAFHKNLGLISARSNRSPQADHFFSGRCATEAKCGESTIQSCLFPLYLYPLLDRKRETRSDLAARRWPPGKEGRRPNLNPDFIADVEARLSLKFIPEGTGTLSPRAPQRGAVSEASRLPGSRCTAGVPPAVSGASRPRFGQVTIRDRGRLPHWEAEGAVYFVTFRLDDSLPRWVLEGFEAERAELLKTAEQMGREPSPTERKRLAELFSQRIETYLDKGCGDCHLADPRVAKLVADALRHFDGQRYRLFAWCVMPNHVHVVFRPIPNHSLARIVQTWKSYTAKRANRIVQREGTFWQREYYDHLVRDEADFHRVVQYLIDNPARARLSHWPWLWVCGQDARTTAGETPAVQPKQQAVQTSDDTLAQPVTTEPAGGPADSIGTFGPEDVFHYIYAIFHSPTYRQRYAEFLKRDFPRVPLTSDLPLFRTLCQKGADLVALHLVEADYQGASWNTSEPPAPSPFKHLITTFPLKGDSVVQNVFYVAPGDAEPGTGKPVPPGRGRVYISRGRPKEGKEGQYFEGVPPEVWEFHVGGYQVCEKWLKDRKGRKLSYDDIQHYHKIVVALKETIRLMDEIDAAIPRWPIG